MFGMIRALLPKSKAFYATQESNLTRFFKAFDALPEDVKGELEKVYYDLFPATTRAFEEWQKQFGVLFSEEQFGDSKEGILDSLWRANQGGQTAQYLQQSLSKVDSRIVVTENVPIKNPRDSNAVYAAMAGRINTCCGNRTAVAGYKIGNSEFVPGVLRNNGEVLYDIPNIPEYWENYFYVGGPVVRNPAGDIVFVTTIQIDELFRPFIEYLILKIKPAQTGAVVFMEWI